MKIFANLGLNNGADNIQNLIPETASEQNPLADKKYVDDNTYTLPAASSDTLGGIKVGEGLTMTEDGVLSASGGGGSGANITYGTEDLTEGVSPLADGTIYFVYE